MKNGRAHGAARTSGLIMERFTIGDSGSLNIQEKRIVKRMIHDGETNQDIQAFINFGRSATINFARISSVKKDEEQEMASKEEMEDYRNFKNAYDPKTGLNPHLDERLFKSRSAMKLAVSAFNNPSIWFRAEVFSVLSTISWTYLIHEYASRKGMKTERKNGKAISLIDFCKDNDCPFSDGVKNNISAIVRLRDLVEHRLLGEEDPKWISIFQANCLNYENFLVSEFGPKLSLTRDLAFSLQFSGLSIGQAEAMAKSRMQSVVSAINADIFRGISEETRDDQEFQFSVIYTTVSASKSNAAFHFYSADSQEGKAISEILIKHKPSAETHPFLATQVRDEVKRRTGRNFTISDHSGAWKRHEVRPAERSKDPSRTNTEFCYYNPVYKRYSYNQKWIDLLCEEVGGNYNP